MKIKILMITHNRPQYTALSLARLTETVPENAKITVWDNASSEETLKVLKRFERNHFVERVIYNRTNDKLWGPTNWFWENSKDADLLSKIDDDCLMPAKWVEKLQEAHNDIPEAGVIGCWRFMPEDLKISKASRKIHAFGHHMLLRNCWVEGSGYLLKRKLIDEIGLLRPKETFTTWCLRAAANGYINGWYYPFMYQEHMDDPRAEHTGIKTDKDLMQYLPLSAAQNGIKTKDDWVAKLKTSAARLQEYSLDPYDFIGVKPKLKRRLLKLLGISYFPKAR
jgi:GT2 family glycosyltransferase